MIDFRFNAAVFSLSPFAMARRTRSWHQSLELPLRCSCCICPCQPLLAALFSHVHVLHSLAVKSHTRHVLRSQHATKDAARTSQMRQWMLQWGCGYSPWLIL